MVPWKRKKSTPVLKGTIFAYEKILYQSPQSEIEGEFDILRFHDWINIVAFTKDNQIILVKQFRAGTERITLEIPGGSVDPGEDFLEAAKRELLEETGYTSKEWSLLGEVAPNPAFQGNRTLTFLAKNCDQTHSQNLDDLEEILIELYPEKDLPQMILSGTINHSLVVAGISFYLLKKGLN